MRLLPNEEKLLVYESICDYAFNHVLTEMAYYLESIMMNIRQTIDANERKQDAFLNMQREKSRKGVEARMRNRTTTGDPTQPTGNPRVTTGDPTQPYNKEQGTRNKERRTRKR